MDPQARTHYVGIRLLTDRLSDRRRPEPHLAMDRAWRAAPVGSGQRYQSLGAAAAHLSVQFAPQLHRIVTPRAVCRQRCPRDPSLGRFVEPYARPRGRGKHCALKQWSESDISPGGAPSASTFPRLVPADSHLVSRIQLVLQSEVRKVCRRREYHASSDGLSYR